jgi:hypothetical protein
VYKLLNVHYNNILLILIHYNNTLIHPVHCKFVINMFLQYIRFNGLSAIADTPSPSISPLNRGPTVQRRRLKAISYFLQREATHYGQWRQRSSRRGMTPCHLMGSLPMFKRSLLPPSSGQTHVAGPYKCLRTKLHGVTYETQTLDLRAMQWTVIRDNMPLRDPPTSPSPAPLRANTNWLRITETVFQYWGGGEVHFVL